jgi:hypothetical protein
MPINLKPILDSQTDNEKLDAVNYNFDQIVSNGGGPMGYQGAKGAQGLDGLTGAQGSQGAQGFQGRQGPQGVNATEYWTKNDGPQNYTLQPIHDSAGGQINPPTVMFGVDETDPLYGQVVDTSSVLINRKSNAYVNNLELTDDDVTNSDGNKVFYTLKLEGGKTIYEMGFANNTSGLPTEWKLYANHFYFSDGTNNFLALESTGMTVYVPAIFTNPVTFNNTVKISSGNPGSGKILVSNDNVGTAVWKSAAEISGLVPIGTIVPILTSSFDSSTNFYKDAINGSPLPDTDTLKVRYGAGKDKYAGWYLCNGKTWTNGSGTSTEVPDLVSFDYEIEARTGGTGSNKQNAVTVTNSKLSLISGGNVAVTASYGASPSAPNDYTITQDIDASVNTLNVPTSGGTAYDLTKLVYIIYLGDTGLFWSDAGAAGTTITHYYALVSRKSTSDSSSGNYTFTVGSTYTLTGLEGSTQTFTITLTPSSGYSFTSTSNVALYTTGIFGTTPDASVTQTSASINSSGQLVLTLTDSDLQNTGSTVSYLQFVGNAVASSTGTGISVSKSTVGFSGTSSSGWTSSTVYISATETNLSNATALKSVSDLSTNAQTGWYAQNIAGSGWCYRYWTGTGFSTLIITGSSTAPGSWYDISTTSTAIYGTVGRIMYANGTYNACSSSKTPNEVATTKIWASVSDLDNLSSGQSAFAIGVASGSNAPIDFTNSGSTYGSGYISVSPCYRLLGYNNSTGVVTRQSISCVEYNAGYDNPGGGGYCSTFSGGGGWS